MVKIITANKRIFRSVIKIFLIVALIFFIKYLWKNIYGWSEYGQVDNVSQLPYVGNILKDFKAEGKIHYKCRVYPARAICLAFAGKTNYNNLLKLFAPEQLVPGEFTESAKEGSYSSMIELSTSEQKQYPVYVSHDDVWAHLSLYDNDDHVIVILNYQTKTGNFTCFAQFSPSGGV